jgi:hypothetical protein
MLHLLAEFPRAERLLRRLDVDGRRPRQSTGHCLLVLVTVRCWQLSSTLCGVTPSPSGWTLAEMTLQKAL